MGLDIALGVMILLGAIRGWFRGFLLQAIRLGGLVGCVYAAAPIRDLARPYILPYLASIRPDLLDRMLWWASAVTCYVATVGLAGLAVKLQRRRPYGEVEPSRADQMAGFLLSAAKGAVISAFLLGALDRYALAWVRKVPWADEQVRASTAIEWNQKYRPAERIWSAPPVQQFVAHVRQMGVDGAANEVEKSREAERAQAAAGRTPRLDLPPAAPPIDPTLPNFVENIDRAMDLIDRVKPGP